ncbi:MAG: Coenzyme A disulfide reductase [Phycisphaerae bacterium]|nr:Coenzyme A disulfide reductase [Phycisphaerae bacterium]
MPSSAETTTQGSKSKLRIVIVGGVAGGATCATRCRRLNEDADILMLERGEHVSFANCGLPYHVGGVIRERDKLVGRAAASFRERYNIEVRNRSEVTAIDRPGRKVTVLNHATGQTGEVSYDRLVLSPGADPIRPTLAGIDDPRVMTLRNVADMDRLEAAARDGSRAVVIGAGFIGLEMAENLRRRGLSVTLVEKLDQVFAPMDKEMAAAVGAHVVSHGVELVLGDGVAGFASTGDRLRVNLESGTSIDADFAVLAIGVRPETTLARKAGLDIGVTGGIRVNEHMQTSDPLIYAVGDAVETTHTVTGQPVLIPLAGPAHKQARAAANHIFGEPDDSYRTTQGTGIVGVFDLQVATTGANERQLRQAGLACEKVYVHAADHAGYYPGAQQLHIKLLFDPQSGRVLGAQAYGPAGVDKRIDVLAVAVRHGLTVHDLREMELAYAPQFGAAKDPVNIAGAIACNALRGVSDVSHFDDAGDEFMLDVRTCVECDAGMVPGAVNIPVDELRSRLAELPKDRAIHVYCGVGMRAYLAERILKQRGFRASNLSGGYTTYRATHAPADARPLSPKPPAGGPGGAGGLPSVETKSDKPTAASGRDGKDTSGSAPVAEVDARQLQCPGPLLKLSDAVRVAAVGDRIRIVAGDPAFGADVAAWAHRTGNRLVDCHRDNGHIVALVEKSPPHVQPADARSQSPNDGPAGFTAVVFSGSMDKALAALVLANGAAANGMPSTLFFTFWGLSLLRRPRVARGQKRSLLDRMFAWMLPAGGRKMKLSQWHFAGAGRWLMNRRMKGKNVMNLDELLASARSAGVRLVACRMSMDMLGLRDADLLEGVEFGGVASFMDTAAAGRVSLFI